MCCKEPIMLIYVILHLQTFMRGWLSQVFKVLPLSLILNDWNPKCTKLTGNHKSSVCLYATTFFLLSRLISCFICGARCCINRIWRLYRQSRWTDDESDKLDMDSAEKRHRFVLCRRGVKYLHTHCWFFCALWCRRLSRHQGETGPVQHGRPQGLQRGCPRQRRRTACPDQRHQTGDQGLWDYISKANEKMFHSLGWHVVSDC